MVIGLTHPLFQISAQSGLHVYYASTNGNDTLCNGLSANSYPGAGGPELACAFRTIKKGADNLSAGDTLQILSGTYFEKLTPPVSGSLNSPITYTAYPGAAVIIDGTGVTLGPADGYADGLVNIVGKSHLKITNLTVRNSGVNGINVRPNDSGLAATDIDISQNTVLNTKYSGIKVNHAQRVSIEKNTVRHTDYSSGIGVWFSDDITITGNTIDTPHWYHECQGAYDEGLTVSGVNRFEVSYNTLNYSESPPPGYCSGAQRLGIDVKESSQNGKVHHNSVKNFDAAGIYVDGWHAGAGGTTATLNHVDIFQNLTEGGGGITIGCEQSDGTVEYINIYNNLVLNSYFSGIQVRGAWGDGLRKNINIYNNTVYGAAPSGGNGGAGIYVTTANLGSNNTDPPVVIRNNISNFYFLTTGGGTVGQIRAGNAAIAAKITADHNIVYGPQSCSQDFPACIELGNRISATPTGLYLNPTANDLHLKTGSPAVNSGAAITIVNNDYDGINRPQETGYDIGAYEFPAALKPGDANGDGKIDQADKVKWLNGYIALLTGTTNGDFDGNRKINGIDYIIWLANYFR